jgi:NEDD4-binding protein 2
MKKLIMVRGISGSGKSTLSKALALALQSQGYYVSIFSTDEYFMVKGEYKFDAKLLGSAHKWNQERAIKALRDSVHVVIVDNTNTQAWEMKPYVQVGVELGYEVQIVEPMTDWKFNAEELAKRNTHGVPIEGIRRMLARWEKDLTVETILASQVK